MVEHSFPVHLYKTVLSTPLWGESSLRRREELFVNPNMGIVFLKPIRYVHNELLEMNGCPAVFQDAVDKGGVYRPLQFTWNNESAALSALVSFLKSIGIELRDIEEKELSFETVASFYPPEFTAIPQNALKLKRYLYSGVWRALFLERTYDSSAPFLAELNLIKGSVTNKKGDPFVSLSDTSFGQAKSVRPLRGFLADRTQAGMYTYDAWTDSFEVRQSGVHIPDDVTEQEHILRIWDSV